MLQAKAAFFRVDYSGGGYGNAAPPRPLAGAGRRSAVQQLPSPGWMTAPPQPAELKRKPLTMS